MPTFNSFQEMRLRFFPVQYEMEHLKREKPMVAPLNEPWWFINDITKEELIEFMDNFSAPTGRSKDLGE